MVRSRTNFCRSVVTALAATALWGCLGVVAPAQAADDERIHRLIENLQEDAGLKVRLTSCMLLGSLGDERAVEPLIEATSDPAYAIRGAAVIALGKIGSLQALPTLFRTLGDSDPFVRRESLKALQAMAEHSEAIPHLLNKAKSGDQETRARAIEVLGGVKNAMAFQAVVDALGDADPAVSDAAAQVVMKRDREDATNVLLQALYSKTPGVRGKALALLKGIGSPRSIQPIAAVMLDDVPGDEQNIARETLVALRDKIEIGGLLLTLANSQDRGAKERSIALLGIKGGEQAVVALIGVVESDNDAQLKGQAAQALAQLGDKRGIEPIQRILKTEKNPRTRAILESALKRLQARN